MSIASKATAASTWESLKPKATYLIIGLLAGPILTNMFGWQMLSGTARDQVRAGVVEQQALFCAAAARGEVADTTKLDYTARTALAEKWAVMPGGAKAEPGVANACARKLSS